MNDDLATESIPENDHNVYVLGAGFSRDAGMPLVRNFLERMRDALPWLRLRDFNREADSIEEVLRFRRAALASAYWTQIDVENIEELFSLSSATHLRSTHSIQRAIRFAIAGTLHFCAFTAKSTPVKITIQEPLEWSAPTPWLKEIPGVRNEFTCGIYTHHLAKMLGLFRNGKMVGKNTFLTFNYDTILEDALNDLEVKFNYRLGQTGVEYDKTNRSQRDGSGVNLLKLHGSVTWGRSSKERKLVVYGNYRDMDTKISVPELIPPTWSKVLGSRLASVWEAAQQAIESATRIVIVGFSLPPTDSHFKYLLGAGLRKNISLRRIDFFTLPDFKEQLKARASRLLRPQYIADGRISFHGYGLAGFLGYGLNGEKDSLSLIGRPAWKPGDKLTLQTQHNSFHSLIPNLDQTNEYLGEDDAE